MNKKLASFAVLLCFSVLCLSSFVIADEDEEGEGIMDAFPEIAVSLVGIIGLTTLILSTKGIGGAVGSGFNLVKIGFSFFVVAFLVIAAGEIFGFEEDIELIFEGLSAIGMIFIAYGPKKLADKIKG